jgi:hypothetical protein
MRLGKKTLQERITEHHKDNPYSVNRVQLDELLQDSITEEVIFHGKELVISFRLPCGFTVPGRSAVVNPEKFDRKKWVGYFLMKMISDNFGYWKVIEFSGNFI